MKKLIFGSLLAVVLSLTATQEAKAQSTSNSTYHVFYNGVVREVKRCYYVNKNAWSIVFWVLATSGPGMYITPVVFDEPYTDSKGKLHLPIGAVLFDEYDTDVTDTAGGIVIGF